MIGLDTNILVRYFTQDDPQQAQRAVEIIDGLSEENPGFISETAFVELLWPIL
jgi:predicted nucleic-acid-binding protein